MKNNYNSTRSKDIIVNASQGILKGLAPDGGLFVPNFIHQTKLNLSELKEKNYGELTQSIFSVFLTDFSEKQINDAINHAYYSGKFENEEPVSLEKISDRFFLELYHGPTCAFKDMALTILPYLMVESMKNANNSNKILILTATSGDTGKAALEGFADVDDISIIVFYPKDGVSTIQEKQMLTQHGDNTCVVGISGNFDDTQNGVKEMLNNPKLKEELIKSNVIFSSANSINIGRLLPQIVYYFYSYFELLKQQEIAQGEFINFVVPTGNFGNILAGYYAKQLGLPINKLICASNANNVLTDFFKTGTYNKNRDFHKTSSPSMDILISSNLERLLYDLSDENPTIVSKLMNELENKGSYDVSKLLMEKAQLFYAGTANEEETASSIKTVFEKTGYLMDPHTAVANKVYDDYLKDTHDSTKTVIVSTASPYKFGRSVYESIFGPNLEDDYTLLNQLAAKTNTTIPNPLKNLDKKENRHNIQCDKTTMSDSVLDFLNTQVNKHD
jgi:threonine synthase